MLIAYVFGLAIGVHLMALLALNGCSDPQAEQNEVLRAEIIKVHDEAMDKIGYMFALETKLTTLQAVPAASEESIDTTVAALQEANSAMFRWMNSTRRSIPFRHR